MNAQKLSRVLAAAFFVLVVLLVGGRLVFPKTSQSKQATTVDAPRSSALLTKSEPDSDSMGEVAIPAAIHAEKQTHHQAKAPEVAKTDSTDPDVDFMNQLAAVALDRATLSVQVEVDCRIKASEKKRAKLIFKETKNGKHIIAYAVKQPSMEEISRVLKPYQMFLGRQSDPSSRQYVDQRFQNLVRHYAMTDGKFRLLYASIPDGAGGGSVMQYSYAASSEQECMEILQQELAPKPPRVIGVPWQEREGQWCLSRTVMRERWRMDHLVSEELLRPFYDSSSVDPWCGIVRPGAKP